MAALTVLFSVIRLWGLPCRNEKTARSSSFCHCLIDAIPGDRSNLFKFFENKSSSFASLEDSFSPSDNGGIGDYMNGYRDARSSYIDAIKTINYFNSESKIVGRESAVIGGKRSYLERGVGSVFLDTTVRTSGMGCFVTQVGASGC